MIEPIRLSFELACPPDRAFTVWTEEIDRWWPADHTVTGTEDLQVVLEPGAGGRIYERTRGGIEHDWGEITIWEPPVRLGYLWHLRRDRADATQVEIRFTAADAGRTRVDIEHRGWEVLSLIGSRSAQGGANQTEVGVGLTKMTGGRFESIAAPNRLATLLPWFVDAAETREMTEG